MFRNNQTQKHLFEILGSRLKNYLIAGDELLQLKYLKLLQSCLFWPGKGDAHQEWLLASHFWKWMRDDQGRGLDRWPCSYRCSGCRCWSGDVRSELWEARLEGHTVFESPPLQNKKFSFNIIIIETAEQSFRSKHLRWISGYWMVTCVQIIEIIIFSMRYRSTVSFTHKTSKACIGQIRMDESLYTVPILK